MPVHRGLDRPRRVHQRLHGARPAVRQAARRRPTSTPRSPSTASPATAPTAGSPTTRDPVFTGKYQVWQDCGGTTTDVVTLVAVPGRRQLPGRHPGPDRHRRRPGRPAAGVRQLQRRVLTRHGPRPDGAGPAGPAPARPGAGRSGRRVPYDRRGDMRRIAPAGRRWRPSPSCRSPPAAPAVTTATATAPAGTVAVGDARRAVTDDAPRPTPATTDPPTTSAARRPTPSTSSTSSTSTDRRPTTTTADADVAGAATSPT